MKKQLYRSCIAIMLVAIAGCATPGKDSQTVNHDRELDQGIHMSDIRIGERPETTDAPLNTNIAHQQITQNSPQELYQQLREYMGALPGVSTGDSRISVPGARSLFLSGAQGPTIAGDERVHLHPAYDGSLHIALEREVMQDLVNKGWGEFHPRNPNTIMLYGPRDGAELEFIKGVIAQGLGAHQPTIQPEEVKKEIVPFSTQALQQVIFSGSSLTLEQVENRNTAYTRYRIFYMSNGYRISGILNIPGGDGPFPLIIFNHGYIDPAIYTVGRGLKREQDYLARQGYAVLHTDYRNHGLSDTDEILGDNYIFRNYFYAHDAINAILAVKNSLLPELASINAGTVGMLGHSMGGGVTMHSLIAQPELIDAAVLYAPVHSTAWYNFDRWRADDLSQDERDQRVERLGGLARENLMPYSATPYVSEIAAPIQIYFGTNDTSVPYQRGIEVQDILTNAGVTSELITYEGEKHEFIREWSAFMQGVTEFFDEQLKQ